jgi:DNA polymerase III subunit delta
MIYKSYLIESNYKLINNISSVLFYGENIGLKKIFKNQIKEINKNSLFINLTQEDILKNQDIFIRELENSSLFGENKIIFIEDCNDKILNILESYLDTPLNFQTIIFSDVLNKKSKLRAFYEKSKIFVSVACYKDNVISIQKIIQNKLKDFQGLSSYNVNMIVETCALNRVNLDNEIEKIITYFKDKKINSNDLSKLLNNVSDESFNELKDEAIKGDRFKTNNLLNSTIMETDKTMYYLSIIYQRLLKLKEIFTQKEGTVEERILCLNPPVFWKDKPILIAQCTKWKLVNLKKALEDIYRLEVKIKSNSVLDKNLMIKKLIVDLCVLANA